MTSELTWSLISPNPVYIENTKPHLYWWFGVGFTEPMLLLTIGRKFFNIEPNKSMLKIACEAQDIAEKAGLFGKLQHKSSTFSSHRSCFLYFYNQINYELAKNNISVDNKISNIIEWIKLDEVSTNDC